VVPHSSTDAAMAFDKEVINETEAIFTRFRRFG
jgi:hypothetical protein